MIKVECELAFFFSFRSRPTSSTHKPLTHKTTDKLYVSSSVWHKHTQKTNGADRINFIFDAIDVWDSVVVVAMSLCHHHRCWCSFPNAYLTINLNVWGFDFKPVLTHREWLTCTKYSGTNNAQNKNNKFYRVKNEQNTKLNLRLASVVVWTMIYSAMTKLPCLISIIWHFFSIFSFSTDNNSPNTPNLSRSRKPPPHHHIIRSNQSREWRRRKKYTMKQQIIYIKHAKLSISNKITSIMSM